MISIASRVRMFGMCRRKVAAVLCSLGCAVSVLAATVTYEYDSLGRLTKVIHSDGSVVTYALDPAGNRTSVASTGPDVTVPTTPGSLTSSVLSATSVRLTWTASTDGSGSGVVSYSIERCAGTGCSNFAEIANAVASATTLDDTTAASSTTYRYQIRARDLAGNVSAYSNITSVTTPAIPDTTAPTTPGSLASSVLSVTAVRLTWTASTDSGGSNLASYRIERCAGASCSNFSEIATAAANATSFDDITAAPLTTYRYQIRARDGSNNDSSYSNITSATTPAAPDTTAPTAPGSLAGSAASSTLVNLTWNASTDTGGSGLASYRVERCIGSSCSNFAEIGSTTTPGYSDTTTTGTTSYRYQVRARDGAGNNSAYSNIVGVVTPDSIPPTAPVIQSATGVSSTRVDITWTASTDTGGSGLSLYRIERCAGTSCSSFAEIGTIAAPASTYSDTATAGTTSYTYRMRAQDGAGLQSVYSNVGGTTTPDTLPPTVPTNLTATAASATQINLAWNASTDQGGGTLASYRIERCAGVGCGDFSLVTHTANLTYSDTSVAGTTTYQYRVRAMDVQSNTSNWSNTASATTPAVPDTTSPGIPGSFAASATSQTSVTLSWTTASDTGGSGLANYRIERCTGGGCSNFVEVGTAGAGATSYGDTGLAGYTTYRYQIRAVDGANNFGAYAGPASATTPDSTAPGGPSGLLGSSSSSSAVNLSWTAAADTGGSGIAHYRIERCTGSGCSTFGLLTTLVGTSYTDTAVSGTTSYVYRVNAVDVAGNVGAYSNSVPVNTPDTIAPIAPTIQSASAVSSTRIDLLWSAGSDSGGSGLALYRIERCTGSGCSSYSEIGTASGAATSYSDNTTAGSTAYVYRMRSQDGAGLLSGYSNVGGATTPDTLGPTTPTNLLATATSVSSISLSWTGSVDQGGGTLASYRIERCSGAGCSNFALVIHTLNLTYNDTSLAGNTPYSYRVLAMDVQSNVSGWSNTATATTPFVPDTTPPSSSNASGSAASSSVINISWTPSTDTGGSGLAGYRLWRCIEPNCAGGYTLIQTLGPGVTGFQDTGLAGLTWHRYYVTPFDGAGNQTPHGSVANVRTL